MLAKSKIKWFSSIILAGTLLVMAVLGGSWGTTYSASASVAAVPHIDSISPSAVAVGSGDTILIIFGSNFGTNASIIRIRLLGTGADILLPPDQVIDNGISLTIPAQYLTNPDLYVLTVLKSKIGTIPTIPTIPNPPNDEISNPVPFSVFVNLPVYLPLVSK